MAIPSNLYSKLSKRLRNHVLAASMVICVCSASPRAFFSWRTDPADLLKGDAITYLGPAQNLVQRGVFVNGNGEPEVTRTPGYPAFLAAMLFLAGQDLRIALIFQAIVLSLGVVFLYWLATSILPPVMAFTAGLIAAFSPWGAALAGLPLSDGLFLVVLVLIFFALKLIVTVHSSIPTAVGGACIGLLTGAAVLVRPFWPLLIIVAVASFLRYGRRRKGVWLLVLSMLACSFTPVILWNERNRREAHFDGLSDISGITGWRYLASRVKAQVNGQDRFALKDAAMLDDRSWNLSIQEKDNERWRRTRAVFQEYPILTAYNFLQSTAEHVIHPSPDVLGPARLNFYGDFFVLALLWGGLLFFAVLGWQCASDPGWDDGEIDRRWLVTLLVVCLLLVLGSGLSFGQGSRLRAPLELVVPLMAAVGLVRVLRSFQHVPIGSFDEPSSQICARQPSVLAVVISVFNEMHTVEALVKRVLASPVNMELRIFIVDDCSSDGSDAVLDRLAAADSRITVLHHTTNRGKGASICTAIEAAEGDFVIIQDADFEYDPADYARIVAPLLRGDADAVFGSRYLNGNERRVLHYWHSLGNAMLTTFFNMVHNIHLTDMETCYKAMPLKLLKNLRLTTDKFGIEPEIASRLIALRARIIEVPIRYNARNYLEGKKIGWRDAVDALYATLKFKYFDTVPCTDAGMVRHITMAGAPRYEQAIASEIKPFLGQRVLEVGAGVGNLARQLTNAKELVLTEPIAEYRRQLAASMEYRNNVVISDCDAFSQDGSRWAHNMRPDTVLCVNQLELLEDDKRALDSLAQAIKPGGRLIILVSCHDVLYGSLDRALKRRRRYNAHVLLTMLRGIGLQIDHQKWLGKLILFGWFIESKISRRHFFNPKPVALLNILSPIMRTLDDLMPWPGLSLLVVARKPL
jgi:2-polyprenyl-3-methyl-5-hydroxy-6-metoxy-1,4-benzoquinol methylase/4-amino-4-deoxy-L-arabinose transferase-like glycosyltransferase